MDSVLIAFIFKKKHFSGCSQPAFFEREKVRDKLSLLKSRGEKYIDLTKRNCQINTISSWYIDCEGKKVASTGSSMEKMFEIEEGSRNYDFEVKCVEKVVAFSPVIIKISVVYYV